MELIDVLSRADDVPVNIYINDAEDIHDDAGFIPAHFHLTEVGLVTKKFVDCGGNMRESATCVLQVWVANDTHHRLNAKKFLNILRHAVGFVPLDTPLVMEYQHSKTIELYSLAFAHVTDSVYFTPPGRGVHISAKPIETACLAPDKCGVKGCC
jgi:hypothetical protein